MTTAERQRKHVAALERVNEKQAAEIERLRTAMVLAMADCEAEANQRGSMTTRRVLTAVVVNLRTALEKP